MDDFYRKFEGCFRGARKVIKERLRVYLPFVKPLQTRHPRPVALDIGCGRGEWLELLTEENFRAKGVDLDAGMLAACKELGLDVEIGDAIETLKALPDESVSIVSAFHMVEHISFDSLMTMLKQALRVLVPGGLLILETPNAENIIVGTLNFYLDPTHLKPIPPSLLSFVVKYYGFEHVKILRLQERAELHNKNYDLKLIDVLDGVSPDYSVVAQKKCNENFRTLFDDAFTKEYGLTLGELTGRYEANMQARLQQVADNGKIEVLSKILHERDIRISQLTQDLYERDDRIKSFLKTIADLSDQVETGKHEAHRWRYEYDRLREEIEPLRNTLIAVYGSSSWRMTAPLRWLKTVTINRLWRSIKVRLKIALSKLAAYVNRHRVLRRMALQIIYRVPGLRLWLVKTIGQPSMQPMQKHVSSKTKQKIKIDEVTTNVKIHHEDNLSANERHLTSRARHIYKMLRMDLKRNCEEKH